MAEVSEINVITAREKKYLERDKRLKEIVTEINKNQRKADKLFEELVKICEKGVFELAYQIVRDREDAMDISQESFVKLWRLILSDKLDYDAVRSWYSYILRIARNTALDYVRRNARQSHDSITVLGDDGETTEIDIADTDEYSNPAAAYERQERIDAVREAIAALPDDYREILTMRELGGCSYTEIAEIMGLEMGTVKSKIFRARENVKKYLQKRNIF